MEEKAFDVEKKFQNYVMGKSDAGADLTLKDPGLLPNENSFLFSILGKDLLRYINFGVKCDVHYLHYKLRTPFPTNSFRQSRNFFLASLTDILTLILSHFSAAYLKTNVLASTEIEAYTSSLGPHTYCSI